MNTINWRAKKGSREITSAQNKSRYAEIWRNYDDGVVYALVLQSSFATLVVPNDWRRAVGVPTYKGK